MAIVTGEYRGEDERHLDAVAIESRVRAFAARLESACEAANRPTGDVRVLLATKTQSTPAISVAVTAARACGLDVLAGENRVQELVAKAASFAELGVATHLIGPLQSNKVNAALRALATANPSGKHDDPAEFASGPSIDSIASLDLAARVSERWQGDRPLGVMVQVNTSGEETKHGVAPTRALELLRAVHALPGLRVTGLMTIGPRSRDVDQTRRAFMELARIRDEAVAGGLLTCADLSMGMSDDVEIAIAAGSTLVRPGEAIFGARRVGTQ